MELALTTSRAFSVEEGKWDKKLVTHHTRQVTFRNGGNEDGKNERAEGDSAVQGRQLWAQTSASLTCCMTLNTPVFPLSLGFLISKMNALLPISKVVMRVK